MDINNISNISLFKNLAFFIILTICNKMKSHKINLLLKVKVTFFFYEEFLSTIKYFLKCLVLFSFYVSNLHHRLSYSLKITWINTLILMSTNWKLSWYSKVTTFYPNIILVILLCIVREIFNVENIFCYYSLELIKKLF